MYGNFVLLEGTSKIEKGERVYLGDLRDKNESWLRNILFDNPEIIPTHEIDPAFGPLVPLCKELRTNAGPIDAVFVNAHGRLTIIECKLWKNPQARREVVAQTLDYVSALAGWTYADLQRQVAAAVGRTGNIPFELVRKRSTDRLREQDFADAVSRSLRDSRLLVLLVGDGIREGIQSLTELVNRSATKAFTFGLIEVAIYRFGKDRFAIQPRVLAETEVVTRQMTIVNMKSGTEPIVIENDREEPNVISNTQLGRTKEHLKAWWQPVLNMRFDDPEQDPPFWATTNNAVLNTPFPGIQIKAYAIVGGSQIGVFVSGPRRANVLLLQKYLRRERSSLVDELPNGTEIKPGDCLIAISESGLSTDNEKRAWITKTLNAFANALRPRLRRWYREDTG